MNKKSKLMIFNRKNLITCINVSFYRLIYEYICWILSGKPDGHSPSISIRSANETKK